MSKLCKNKNLYFLICSSFYIFSYNRKNFALFTKSEIELSAFNPIFNKESIEEFFREIIMDHENDINKVSASFDDYMARVFSKSHSSKSKKSLILQEQHSLINDLFACNEPSVSPFNQKIFKVIPLKSIENKILK